MENTKKPQDQGNTGIGNQGQTGGGNQPHSGGSQATAAKQAEDKNQHNQQGNTQSALANGTTEAVDQAKQVVTDAYNRASKSLNEGYSQAMDYGRENPGKTTLIALGAGIGIGLLLAGSLSSSRSSRTGRIVPPVMNALTEIAREVFR